MDCTVVSAVVLVLEAQEEVEEVEELEDQQDRSEPMPPTQQESSSSVLHDWHPQLQAPLDCIGR